LYWLKRFCKFAETNPDSLIADRNKTLESTTETVKRKHEELLENFITMLRDKKYSTNSISTATGMIRSFYKSNYVGLIEVSTVRPYPIRPHKVPTRLDIKKMCAVADPAIESWILCQFQSGLGNTDLLSLSLNTLSSEFGTIKNQLKKGVVPIHIEIRRQKTQERTDTFFGPNAIDALNEYVNLDTRGRIFRMSVRTIQQKVKRIAIEAKVATKQVPINPYSLRRAFNTLMKFAGMNEALVERMMGHSIGRVRSAYLVTGRDEQITGIPIKTLAEEYMKYYDAIDITKV